MCLCVSLLVSFSVSGECNIDSWWGKPGELQVTDLSKCQRLGVGVCIHIGVTSEFCNEKK